jgi:ubiquinone/menaquinone biosynthesis C-methylase UbiE
LQRSFLGYEAQAVDMKTLRDPEGAEISHLIAACELAGKKVLEIGCGEGKLTRQYTGMPRILVGIDPNITDLRTAKNEIGGASFHLHIIQAIGEKLPFPSNTFDIVILASSL